MREAIENDGVGNLSRFPYQRKIYINEKISYNSKINPTL